MKGSIFVNSELVIAREKILKIYRQWETELHLYCNELIAKEFSYPYYLYIPDNWFDSEIRIMIVGEEGAGEKQYDCSIEEAQKFNKEYLISQLHNGDENYDRNRSQFWNRFRKIARLPGVSVCWNNLDKIHMSRAKNCALKPKQRNVLHQTPTKILREEIKLLRPTHVIFFGWYGVSLQQECPEVFDILYPNGLNDSSAWEEKKMVALTFDNIYYLFTYHPGWRRKSKDYEHKVMQQIERMIKV